MAGVREVYLLDADVCVYAMTRRSPAVLDRFDRLRPGEALISVVAYGELLFGLSKSRTPDAAAANLAALASRVSVEPLPVSAGEHYARVRRGLEAAGTPIGGNDLWLAAHALASGLVLVTNNEREFRRVPGLVLENWTAPGVRERRAAYARRRAGARPRGAASPAPHDPAAELRRLTHHEGDGRP